MTEYGVTARRLTEEALSDTLPGHSSLHAPTAAVRGTIVAIGQNLLDKAHFEFGLTEPALLTTNVPRSAGIRVRWTFR